MSYTTSPAPVPANTAFTLTWNSGITLNAPANQVMLTLIPSGGGSSFEFFGVSGAEGTFLTTFNVSALPYNTYFVNVDSGLDGYSVNGPNLTNCFVEGSEILCVINNEEEYVKIEDLKIGDSVKTYNNSPKKISYILKNTFKNDKSYSQICKLSNYPNQTKDLFLTGGHSILVDELTQEQKEKTEKVWGQPRKIDDKYLLLAFIDENAEKIEDEKEYNVYHIALENEDKHGQYGIYVNGILSETMSLDCYLTVTNSLVVSEYIL
jgi:hypothetical protein